MENLRTDYKDDILNESTNIRRKYRMENNDDGTVSFVDVTDYSQEGDSFGSADINKTNASVNEVNSILETKFIKYEDLALTSEYGTISAYNISQTGDIIYVNLRISIAKEVPLNTAFIRGLPYPDDTYAPLVKIISLSSARTYNGYILIGGSSISNTSDEKIPIGTYDLSAIYRKR